MREVRAEPAGGDPQFLSSIINASVPVGRDAALECYITRSQGYKVRGRAIEEGKQDLEFPASRSKKRETVRVDAGVLWFQVFCFPLSL